MFVLFLKFFDYAVLVRLVQSWAQPAFWLGDGWKNFFKASFSARNFGTSNNGGLNQITEKKAKGGPLEIEIFFVEGG